MKSLFYSMLMVAFCTIPFSTSAQSYGFSGGKGTTAEPYKITTPEDLNHVNDFLDASFIIMNDIDMTGVVWTPIGTSLESAYTGTFDGNNKVIRNFTINSGSDGVGFFGRVHSPAVVKNIIMENAEVIGGNWCGILMSTNGNWQHAGGTIQNCKVRNSYLEGTSCIAAIAGVDEGSIENCEAINVNVDGTQNTIGGIIGEASSGAARHISDCVFSGNISGTEKIGGIVGSFAFNGNDRPATLYNCVSYGEVNGSVYVGGIVGYQQGIKSVIIDHCASFANISGSGIGGIGGDPIDGVVQYCYAAGRLSAINHTSEIWNGGIVGAPYQKIADCYFSGSISSDGQAKIGGIGGRNWPSTSVVHCFYNSDGAPMNMGDGNDEESFDAKGLLPEEMVTLSKFKFTDNTKWQIIEGKTTPFFTNQTAPVTIKACNTSTMTGTCSSNVKDLYFVGSISQGISNVSVSIDNGNWTATWGNDAVFKGETVTVIAKEDGKMPSMPMNAKVDQGAGIGSNAGDRVIISVADNKVTVDMPELDNAQYSVISISGIIVKAGTLDRVTNIVDLTDLGQGIYLFRVKANGISKTETVAVK